MGSHVSRIEGKEEKRMEERILSRLSCYDYTENNKSLSFEETML